MIELRNINKSYGNLHVLKDISLTIPDSGIMAVVGASGAGKTTLLQIAGTLESPDTGSVSYDGVELTRLNDRRLSEFRNRNIGFIFQFHQLLPEFTALENAAMPAMIGGASKREATQRARELLETLGLGGRLRHKPAELSGGEKQRVAIARALVNGPRVVFADEPTGSLDTHNRDEIRMLIKELNATTGQTFVIVTHDAGVATIADNVVTIEDGRIFRQTSVTVESDESVESEVSAESEESVD